jgi:hypothetical protein
MLPSMRTCTILPDTDTVFRKLPAGIDGRSGFTRKLLPVLKKAREPARICRQTGGGQLLP